MEKLESSPKASSSSVSVLEYSSILSLLAPFRFLLPRTALLRVAFDSATITTGFGTEVEEVGGGGGDSPLVFCCDDRSETAGETEGPWGGGHASNSEEEEEDVALFASSDRGELKN